MNRDKSALRALLNNGASGPFNWRADPHTLTNSQRIDLAAMAKTIGYRKSVSSSLSLGAAFFVYLCKDAIGDNLAAPKQSGQRWNNHNIAKG